MSARLAERIAAAICLARVDANPDGCGGGAIGYHAIGEPGGCPECRAGASRVLEEAAKPEQPETAT